MTTKSLTIKFAIFSEFYGHGISQEKTMFLHNFPQLPPLTTLQNANFINVVVSASLSFSLSRSWQEFWRKAAGPAPALDFSWPYPALEGKQNKKISAMSTKFSVWPCLQISRCGTNAVGDNNIT